MAEKIYLFDTTLRDGAQGAGIDFSLSDKYAIAKALDAFGIDFIEGGWPGANPADSKFFDNPPKLARAKLIAFGMTCKAKKSAANDPGLAQVINNKSSIACIVGKTSTFQVEQILKISPEENLRIIQQSCEEVVKRKGQGNSMFDAEHFFDGYKDNPNYALQCIESAQAGGASWVILCDTNGGSMPDEVELIVRQVVEKMKQKNPELNIGIHAHNDTGNAIANSLAAVRAGARQVQGTINGIGERCGNADLIAIIPNLMLKMKLATSVDEKNLGGLLELSRLLDSRINRVPRTEAPYVGSAAFAHKGGLHGAAVAKNTRAYEHIVPEIVGNRRNILVSDQAGKANLIARINNLKILDGKSEVKPQAIDRLLEQIKIREAKGYSYEDADASLSLLVIKAAEQYDEFFNIHRFRVTDERRWNALGEEVIESEAVVSLIESHNGVSEEKLTAANSAQGPVNALDKALRKGLAEKYPSLKNLRLADYRVRIIPPEKESSGSEATTRVSIDFIGKNGEAWTTVGVSANIIVASLQALADSYRYLLFREMQSQKTA